MKSTQTNTEKEAQGGNKREEGGGDGHRDAQRELPEQPSCWVSLFYRLFPSDPPPSSLSGPRFAFSYFFGLLQTKQNAKQTYFLYTVREKGREVGRQRGRANTFVCKYEKFKAHTLSVLKHALIQTHTHTRPHSHTHMWTFTHLHTHISRRTHVGYLMLFSIQATLFAAAFAAPSRVFIFSHPLKQALQSPCI